MTASGTPIVITVVWFLVAMAVTLEQAQIVAWCALGIGVLTALIMLIETLRN